MAYNYRPQSVEDIKLLNFKNKVQLIDFYKYMKVSFPKNDEYITLDTSVQGLKQSKFKVLRSFSKKIDLKDLKKQYPKLCFNFGNGSNVKGSTPSTAQQERVTSLIFECIYGKKKGKYNDFADILPLIINDNNLYPKIMENKEWFNHFKLQFENLKTKTQSVITGTYSTVNRDNGFMEIITDVVRKRLGLQKDTWNPADIWLYNESSNEYKNTIKELEKVKDGQIGLLNDIMRKAYIDKTIIGISLKKSNGKQLNFSENNIIEPSLTKLVFKDFNVDFSYNEQKHCFNSVTSILNLKNKNENIKFSARSNQGDISNITFEFNMVGSSAFIGKTPKEDMTFFLKKINPSLSLPQHKTQPKKITGKSDLKVFEKMVKEVSSSTFYKTYKDNNSKSKVNTLVNDMIDCYINGAKEGKNKSSAMVWQILEFLWICCKVFANKGINVFTELITDFFYAAQKVGKTYGPFAKLY